MPGKTKCPESKDAVEFLVKLDKDFPKKGRTPKNKYSIKIESFPHDESGPEIAQNPEIAFAPRLIRRGSHDHFVPCVPSPGDVRRMFGCSTINHQPEYAQPGLARDPRQWGTELQEGRDASHLVSGPSPIEINYLFGLNDLSYPGNLSLSDPFVAGFRDAFINGGWTSRADRNFPLASKLSAGKSGKEKPKKRKKAGAKKKKVEGVVAPGKTKRKLCRKVGGKKSKELSESELSRQKTVQSLAQRIFSRMTATEWNRISAYETMRARGEIDAFSICLLVEKLISRTLGESYVHRTLSLLNTNKTEASLLLVKILLSFNPRGSNRLQSTQRKSGTMNGSNRKLKNTTTTRRQNNSRPAERESRKVSPNRNSSPTSPRKVRSPNKSPVSQTKSKPVKIRTKSSTQKNEANIKIYKKDIFDTVHSESSTSTAAHTALKLRAFMGDRSWRKIQYINDTLCSNGSINVEVLLNAMSFIIGKTIGENNVEETLSAINPDKTKAVVILAKEFLNFYQTSAVIPGSSNFSIKSDSGTTRGLHERRKHPSRVSSENWEKMTERKSMSFAEIRQRCWGNTEEKSCGIARNLSNRFLNVMLTEYASNLRGEVPGKRSRCSACERLKTSLHQRNEELHLWDEGRSRLVRIRPRSPDTSSFTPIPNKDPSESPSTIFSRLLSHMGVVCRSNGRRKKSPKKLEETIKGSFSPVCQKSSSDLLKKIRSKRYSGLPIKSISASVLRFNPSESIPVSIDHLRFSPPPENKRISTITVYGSNRSRSPSSYLSQSADSSVSSLDKMKTREYALVPIVCNLALKEILLYGIKSCLYMSKHHAPETVSATEKSVVRCSDFLKSHVDSLVVFPTHKSHKSESRFSRVGLLSPTSFPTSEPNSERPAFMTLDTTVVSKIKTISEPSEYESMIPQESQVYSVDNPTGGMLSDKIAGYIISQTTQAKKVEIFPEILECMQLAYNSSNEHELRVKCSKRLPNNSLVPKDYFDIKNYKPTAKKFSYKSLNLNVIMNILSAFMVMTDRQRPLKISIITPLDQKSEWELEVYSKLKSYKYVLNVERTPGFDSIKMIADRESNEDNQICIRDERRRQGGIEFKWNTWSVLYLMGSLIAVAIGFLAWYYIEKLT